MRRLGRYERRGIVLQILALILAACSGTAPARSATLTPTPDPAGATMSVVEPSVQRIRQDDAVRDLKAGDLVDLRPQDLLRVRDKGRAFLEFANKLEVEVVRGTELQIGAIQPGTQGPAQVTLTQTLGQTFSQLGASQGLRFVLQTDYATVTATADHAQFLVCQVPGSFTCVIVVNGEAQVNGQGQSLRLTVGQGTYVAPGQPPRPVFCADMTQVRDWLYKMRSTQDTTDLGSLVAGWLQRPCASASTPAAGAPTVTSGTSAAASTQATGTPQATPTAAAPAAPAEAATPTLPSREGMVQVAAGSYTVGGPAPDANHIAETALKLAGYWLDKYEVTYAQYAAFLSKTGHAAPATWPGGAYPAGHEKYPAAGLTWDDAAAYCVFTGKRLPSEAEWEAAGRGTGAAPPLYPWGADPTAGGKTDSMPARDAYEVGSLAFNASPLGVFDMIGSVWQWVGEPYAPAPDGAKILRGGRHGLLEDLAYRQPAQSDDARFLRFAGVRCAADHVVGE